MKVNQCGLVHQFIQGQWYSWCFSPGCSLWQQLSLHIQKHLEVMLDWLQQHAEPGLEPHQHRPPSEIYFGFRELDNKLIVVVICFLSELIDGLFIRGRESFWSSLIPGPIPSYTNMHTHTHTHTHTQTHRQTHPSSWWKAHGFSMSKP